MIKMVSNKIPVLLVSLICLMFINSHSAAQQTITSPDAYEPDDSFSQARVIVLNDPTPQHHNFHKAADQDWVKFYGLAGETYTVKATDLGERCDIALELYDSDGKTLLKARDDGKYGQDEILEWVCTKEAVLYVKARQYNPDIFGEGTDYNLSVYKPVGPPVGVISGIISNNTTGALIDGAVITTDGGGSAISADGSYILLHPAGTYKLAVNADGYTTLETTITITGGETITKDIVLAPDNTNQDGLCPVEKMYGAESKEAVVLRKLRDTVLRKTPEGRKLIRRYYQWSPRLLTMMENNESIKDTLKTLLGEMLPLIETYLQGVRVGADSNPAAPAKTIPLDH
jgi:hypothetical protein